MISERLYPFLPTDCPRYPGLGWTYEIERATAVRAYKILVKVELLQSARQKPDDSAQRWTRSSGEVNFDVRRARLSLHIFLASSMAEE